MAHASNTEAEEMDDEDRCTSIHQPEIDGGDEMDDEDRFTSTDMPEIDGGDEMDDGADVILPMGDSNDFKKEQENGELMGEIRQKLNKMSSHRPSDCTIYRIPAFVLGENPAAYIPHIVSIGPFHHDQPHLQPMEARKMQYLKDFLHRSSPEKLKDYFKAITDLVEKAKQCYAKVEHQEKDFVMMMVVDGCFILELLLRKPKTESDAKWIFLVLQDLILLENQLPFIVLEALYKVYKEDSGHDQVAADDLTSFMCKNFVPRIFGLLFHRKKKGIFGLLPGDVKMNSPEEIKLREPKHLLDLVQQFLKPPQLPAQTSVGKATKCLHFVPACVSKLCSGDGIVRIRCATELEKAGVKFRKNKNPTSLLDIKFAHGVLTIPGIRIDHSTQSILRNLLAYGQYTDDYNYITEYAAFLDGLIDSRNDVELLRKNGIIEIVFGDSSDIARLFNSLLKDSAVYLYYTSHVRQKVEWYYNKPWHKWKASLMLNCFSNLWTILLCCFC